MSLEEAIVVVGESRRRFWRGAKKKRKEASSPRHQNRDETIGVKGKELFFASRTPSRRRGSRERGKKERRFRRYLKFGFPSSARSPAVLREGGSIRAVDISPDDFDDDVSSQSFICVFSYRRMRGNRDDDDSISVVDRVSLFLSFSRRASVAKRIVSRFLSFFGEDRTV